MIIYGKTIGRCDIGDILVLFTFDPVSSISRIYKVNKPNSSGKSTRRLLFEGDLNFSLDNKIQAISFYESESVQKVYWIDGINQPRVINVADNTLRTQNDFDFVKTLSLNETVSVSKIYNSGSFKAGVIQYALTYFTENGSESNIFYLSDLLDISFADRAGKVEETVPISFKITASNLDTKYKYVRLYSIYRSSLNTSPLVSLISNIEASSGSVSFTDTGLTNISMPSDILLYIGGDNIVPKVMAQKDSTLFLGGIESKNDIVLAPTLKTNGEVFAVDVPNHSSTFSWELSTNGIEFEKVETDKMYPYRPFKTNIRHFKFDETYRLGLQFQTNDGKWSTPMWLGDDYTVDKRYQSWLDGPDVANNIYDKLMLKYVYGKYQVDDTLKQWFISNNFKKVRPLMVPLNYSERTILAQGLLTNTIGISSSRKLNKSSEAFALPDYKTRVNWRNPRDNDGSDNSKIFGAYGHFDIITMNALGLDTDVSGVTGHKHYNYIEFPQNQLKRPDTVPSDARDYNYTSFSEIYTAFPGNYDNFNNSLFFIDNNVVNMWSPDILYNTSDINKILSSSSKIGLYGFSFRGSLSAKLEIVSTLSGSSAKTWSYISSEYLEQFDLSKNFKSSELVGNLQGNTYALTSPWAPDEYSTDLVYPSGSSVTFNYTKNNRSLFSYFSYNNNIKDGVRIEYDINNPKIFSDNLIYPYVSNYEDNQESNGSILYSKYVDKTYPANYYRGLLWTQYVTGGNFNFIKSGSYIKYNTNSHALFSFKKKLYGASYKFPTIPKIKDPDDEVAYPSTNYIQVDNPTWYRGGTDGFATDMINKSNLSISIPTDANKKYSVRTTLPIIDLYSNFNPALKYGGKTNSALQSNQWIIAGDTVNITSSPLVVNFTIGDTYIKRFDLLKTFPEDINQVSQQTEIISFICESFVNMDGRSDINRYNTDSSFMTTNNYGILNKAYSQQNNYFQYSIINRNLFNVTNYPNTIVWSSPKTTNSVIDSWTNINMSNSLDLDGVFGEVTSLNLFNNQLYFFQKKAIGRILYNERIQQAASDSMDVQLTNGYSTPNFRYMTTQYGSDNWMSIVESKSGIYFVDRLNKTFCLLNQDGVSDIASSYGFKSWFRNNLVDGGNLVLSYDKINSDIYIHDNDVCFNFSEILKAFQSNYEYTNDIKMLNIWDKFVSIKTNELNQSNIWIAWEGDYNVFFGQEKPFHIEYVLNPDPTQDKIFNTFEYRINNTDIDFNKVSLSNWYQNASVWGSDYLTRMKRKFNVNRFTLPRNQDTTERLRSTWLKMKVEHQPVENTANNNSKFEMEDLTLTYTV